MTFLKKFLKIILLIVLAVVLIAALFIGYLTLREYRPADVEPQAVRGSGGLPLSAGEELSIVTWNVGYCGLGKFSDFVLDGGGNAPVPDEARVQAYASGIRSTLEEQNADFCILQEVDQDSARSYSCDQRDLFTIGEDSMALNYSCDFVPFPWPPLGKIHSGVFTTSVHDISAAERISLPCPFSWPLRVANLKRCMLVSHFPLAGSEKELCLVNFHLEAYDSGEGKILQTKQLLDFIESEYAKGNYVIAGGDWNQTFPDTTEKYPNTHEDIWAVGNLEYDILEQGWQLAFDDSVPTCRLLNQPYDPADKVNTQYYVIDGFVVSPNVSVNSVKTIPAGFENSDHNPVRMSFTLEK